MTNDEHDSTSDVQRLIASAGDVAGTAMGALVSISTANPAFVFAGSVLGSVLGNSVGEIAARTLSNRQERRAGALVVAAFGELKAKEVMGRRSAPTASSEVSTPMATSSSRVCCELRWTPSRNARCHT